MSPVGPKRASFTRLRLHRGPPNPDEEYQHQVPKYLGYTSIGTNPVSNFISTHAHSCMLAK